jgi:hypothetical protein
MTANPFACPRRETRNEDVNDHPLSHRKQHQAPVAFPVLKSIRRTAPASRPHGRCTVGLRPSLDSDAYFDAPSQHKEPHKTNQNNTAIGLDRPHSLRNDLRLYGGAKGIRTLPIVPPNMASEMGKTGYPGSRNNANGRDLCKR